MHKITAFKTTDGQTFEDERKATTHELTLSLRTWAEREGVGRGGRWDADMVVDQMLKNADELASILTKYVRFKGISPYTGPVSLKSQVDQEAQAEENARAGTAGK